MPTVTVAPSGISLDVTGETVFDAARRAGFRWPTACGGMAQCGVCQTLVLEGNDRTNAVTSDEAEILARFPASPTGVRRLACRLQADGDLALHKPGVAALSTR